MKKTIFILVLFCSLILSFSFKGKSTNEGESDTVIVTRNIGSLIISYGNSKSEIVELRGGWNDKAIISDNDLMIKTLNQLKSQGYEIKTTISSGLTTLGLYSIVLEKK